MEPALAACTEEERQEAMRRFAVLRPQRFLPGGCLLELTGERKVGCKPIPSASAKRQAAHVRYIKSI